MDELSELLKKSLATTFAFYLKAHNFHWNVEGPFFSQYHEFFETLYTDAFEATDGLAEHIRTLNVYAPGSFKRFGELSTIQDELTVPNAAGMLNRLYDDNNAVIATLIPAQKAAEAAGQVGIANYLQDRIDIHNKHAWMLRATKKS
jgi:starvation-inducible DNA-binding protein